jgi:enamine deaminase RidA (YjgF/YER057c/UK114 family)
MPSSRYLDRIAELAIELPAVPRPIANFVPWRVAGDLVFLSGQICEWNGSVTHAGRVGEAHDLAAAREAARICGLNLIAALKAASEATGRDIGECIRLGGFVHCALGYPDVPKVIDGASDLMHQLFGAHGAHARTSVGVASLPRNAAVEVDAVFALA